MLRVCVIGLGHIGNLHARIYQEDDMVELVGVCDVNRERADAGGGIDLGQWADRRLGRDALAQGQGPVVQGEEAAERLARLRVADGGLGRRDVRRQDHRTLRSARLRQSTAGVNIASAIARAEDRDVRHHGLAGHVGHEGEVD